MKYYYQVPQNLQIFKIDNFLIQKRDYYVEL